MCSHSQFSTSFPSLHSGALNIWILIITQEFEDQICFTLYPKIILQFHRRQLTLLCRSPSTRTQAKRSPAKEKSNVVRKARIRASRGRRGGMLEGQRHIHQELSLFTKGSHYSICKGTGNLSKYQDIISSPIMNHLTHVSIPRLFHTHSLPDRPGFSWTFYCTFIQIWRISSPKTQQSKQMRFTAK